MRRKWQTRKLGVPTKPTSTPRHLPCDQRLVGRDVRYQGIVWRIIGINYLQSYDIERWEKRTDGTYRIESTCVLGLPATHPHYAEVTA